MKIKPGLYLNEENGQTFEVVDVSAAFCYVQYPDFFWSATVHADEGLKDIDKLKRQKKIAYIGEV